MGPGARARAVALLGALAAPLLAGCAASGGGAGGDAGFTIAPDGGTGGYVFHATAAADNYTWDLGDHLTVLHGRTVRHAYDLKDGSLTVTLAARTGGVDRITSLPLVLGSGRNAPATFLLEGETAWAVVGEPVSFSAHRSTDPDGDPLRLTWSCQRVAEAQRVPAHYHAPPPPPFSSTPAGSVTAGPAPGPLPAPDATFPDLCAGLGAKLGPKVGLATVRGAFPRPGVYLVGLSGSDGVHAPAAGTFRIYVTPPGERPAPTVAFHGTGTLAAGRGGALQPTCDAAGAAAGRPVACDEAVANFTLPLGGLALRMNLTVAGPTTGSPAAAVVAWHVTWGPSTVASGTGPVADQVVVNDTAKLPAGAYHVVLQLQQGADCTVAVDGTVRLDLDPTKVY